MNPWRQFPMIRLIMPVFLGMATGIFLKPDLYIPLVLPGTLFLFLGIVVFTPTFIFPYSLRWITGMLIVSLTSMLSLCILISGNDLIKKDYFGNLKPAQRCYIGEITEPVTRKVKSAKVILRIISAKENGRWSTTSGSAMVYFGKSPGTELLCYGDRLMINTQFTLAEGSRNPGGFDSRRYLQLRGIFRQAYVKPGHWRLITHGNRNPVFRMALTWRDRMLMILKANGVHGNEFAVAGALLLGYVDEIDSDLRHDYSATGVMHILCVSGMHVGMIFLVLDKLLAFLEKRKKGIIIKTVLVMIFIWLYAFVTGLSPAVLRAAAMLSLIMTGKAMKRHPDILNILAASAIFLVIWQPILLAALGFQLSYLAVVGIVVLYKPIYNLFLTKNWLLDKIWSIVAVSISAQLATFPLCLYYFHQFPNYFMITNIIVIPLANLIIYSGILALVLGSIPWISVVVAKGLSLLLWCLNSYIHWMGSLPFSVTRGLFITFAESLILYLILVTAGLYISGKKKVWIFISISMMILLMGNFLQEKYRQVSMNSFTVYDVKPGLYDFTGGGKSILFGGLLAMKDPFFKETILKLRWNTRVTGLFQFQYPLPFPGHGYFHSDGFSKRGGYISFRGKRIVILNKPVPKGVIRKLEMDYLIISGNPKIKLKELQRNFRPGMVIFDASNSLWKVKEWIKEAHGLGIRCYSVGLSGAFREEF